MIHERLREMILSQGGKPKIAVYALRPGVVLKGAPKGQTQLGPTQKQAQVEFLQFFCPSPCEAVILPWAIFIFHSNELLSPKVLLDLHMVASVVKNPTTFIVIRSCRRALSERALWL